MIRKLAVALTGAVSAVVLSFSLAVPAQASADDNVTPFVTGDRTITYADSEIMLASNDCSAAYVNWWSDGGPNGAVGTYNSIFANDSSSCTSRVQFRWMTKRANVGGVHKQSGYLYRSTTSPGAYAFRGLRCSTEFAVRRDDGSYFTRTQISGSFAFNGCPD